MEQLADELMEKTSKHAEIARDVPVEDIVWIVTRLDDVSEDCSDEGECDDLSELWTVVDTRKAFIGSAIRKQSEGLKEFVMKLLTECIKLPFSWKPRRPKYLTFTGLEKSERVEVSGLGINILEDVHVKPCSTSAFFGSLVPHSPMQSCSLCQRRGSPELFTTCSVCCGVYYCCTDCEKKDTTTSVSDSEKAKHSDWCQRMASYVQDARRMAVFPFTFTHVTTSAEFDEPAYCEFQQSLGVYGRGLWRREKAQPLHEQFKNYGDILYKEHILDFTNSNNFVIESLDKKLEEDIKSVPASSSLKSWEDYYSWRGLSFDSPCAILMHWPLTIYHVIVNLMDKLYPDQAEAIQTCQKLRIHILGVQKEVDILPVFYELENLFPAKSLEITMIGNDITRKLTNHTISQGKRLHFVFEKGFYHSLKFDQEPHLAIGFNAGIGAYSSWNPTIHCLSQQKTPVFFTDYCQYSCECSRPAVKSTGSADLSDVLVNPFRCPVRKYSEGTAFPCYSNGFIFCLKYTDGR